MNILGIAVGIALFVSINATSTAYKKAVSRPFKNLGADLVVQRAEKRNMKGSRPPASMRGIRLPFSNQLLSPRDLNGITQIEGIDVGSSALLLWEFEKQGFRTIMGVDLEQPDLLGPVKVKEKRPEIMETPPINSRNESELLTDTPFSSLKIRFLT